MVVWIGGGQAVGETPSRSERMGVPGRPIATALCGPAQSHAIAVFDTAGGEVIANSGWAMAGRVDFPNDRRLYRAIEETTRSPWLISRRRRIKRFPGARAFCAAVTPTGVALSSAISLTERHRFIARFLMSILMQSTEPRPRQATARARW